MRYEDKVTLTSPPFDDADALAIADALEQLADVEVDPPEIRFAVEAPDGWTLRERVDEIAVELSSRGLIYLADETKIVR